MAVNDPLSYIATAEPGAATVFNRVPKALLTQSGIAESAAFPGFANYPVRAGEAGVTKPWFPHGHVERYGAVGDGVTDCTAAIRAAVVATGSGGTLHGTPGSKYRIFPEGATAPAALGTWTGASPNSPVGVIMEDLWLDIDPAQDYSGLTVFRMFGLRNVDFVARRVKVTGSTIDTAGAFGPGPYFVEAFGGCPSVVYEDCDIRNVVIPLIANPLNPADDTVKTRGIRWRNVRLANVEYGIQLYDNGDNADLDYSVEDCHRAFIIQGVSGVRANVRVKNPQEQAQIADVDDLELRYTELESTTAVNKVKVNCDYKGVSAISNSKIKLFFDVNFGGFTGGPVLRIDKTTDGTTASTADIGHRMDGLEISGRILGTPTADQPCILMRTDASWTPAEHFTGINLRNLHIPDSWVSLCGDPVEDVAVFDASRIPRGIRWHRTLNTLLPPAFGQSVITGVEAQNLDRWRDINNNIIQLGGANTPALNVFHSLVAATYLGPAQYGRTMTNEEMAAQIDYILPSAVPGKRLRFVRTKNFNLDLDPVWSASLVGAHSIGGTVLTLDRDVFGLQPGDSIVVNGAQTYTVTGITGMRTVTVPTITANYVGGESCTRTAAIRGNVAASNRLRLQAVGDHIELVCNIAQTWDIASSRGTLYNVSQAANW